MMNTIVTTKSNQIQNINRAPRPGSQGQIKLKLSMDDALQKEKANIGDTLNSSKGQKLVRCNNRFFKPSDVHIDFQSPDGVGEITVWVVNEITGRGGGTRTILERRVFKLPMGTEKITGTLFDVLI